LLSTLFLADLLNIKTVCIPYIPYSRNKHLFDIFLKKLNTEVVTFDLHFFNAVSMLYEKVTNVPLRRVFRGEIKGDWDKAFVLAPDKGAIKRATEFAEDNGLPVFSASKERGGGGAGGSGDSCNVYLPPIDTSIFTRCFIVDDMIYSGKTILTTITGLNKIGISDISIFVTHVLPESQTLYRETFLEILRKASTFVTTNIHDVADMYSRPVAKASNFEGFLGAHEAQNRSVLNVREDSSIGATLKLQKERSFRNRSNSSAQQCVELEGGNIWQGLQPPTIIDVTNILVGIIQKNVTTQP
jgi:hypothetical protein